MEIDFIFCEADCTKGLPSVTFTYDHAVTLVEIILSNASCHSSLHVHFSQ